MAGRSATRTARLHGPGPLAFPALVPNPAAFEPPPLLGARRLVPGAKAAHERDVAAGRVRYSQALAEWQAADQQRLAKLAQHQAVYDAEIDAFRRSLDAGQKEAVVDYATMVLSGSMWPDGFPQEFSLAYEPQSHLLGIDYLLPGIDVIPTVKNFKYVKTRDEMTSTALPEATRRSLYGHVVAASALRVLREVFESDRCGNVAPVALNCFVAAVNRATGQPIKPCVLSVRTTRDVFSQINLGMVDVNACLEGLAAAVSPSPGRANPGATGGRVEDDRSTLRRGGRCSVEP